MFAPPLYLSESRRLRYAVFFLLYVVEGLPAGFGAAVGYYLAAEGVAPAVLGLFAARAALPWTFQFVWGPVLDRFQGSQMGGRRAWVLGAQVLAAAAACGVLLVQNPPAEVGLLAGVLFLHGLCSSVQDTAVDALAIGVTPAAERGRTNAVMRAGFLVGVGGGTVGFAHLLRHHGFHTAAGVQAAVLLLLAGTLLLVRERPGDRLFSLGRRTVAGNGRTVGAVLAEMWGGILTRRSLRLAVPAVAGYLATSLFLTSLTIHLLQRQGWADTEVATFFGLGGTAAALLVSLVGGHLADRLGAGRQLRLTLLGLGLFLVGFGLLGDRWAAPGAGTLGLAVAAAADPLLSVAAMPALMAVCRRGVEGSQFTAYMAVVNQAGVVGAFLAGRLLGVTTAPVLAAAGGLVLLLAAATVRPPAPAEAS